MQKMLDPINCPIHEIISIEYKKYKSTTLYEDSDVVFEIQSIQIIEVISDLDVCHVYSHLRSKIDRFHTSFYLRRTLAFLGNQTFYFHIDIIGFLVLENMQLSNTGNHVLSV